MKAIKEYQLFEGDEIQAEGLVRVVKVGMHSQGGEQARPCVRLQLEREVPDPVADEDAELPDLEEGEPADEPAADNDAGDEPANDDEAND